jgi:uncharacterized protein
MRFIDPHIHMVSRTTDDYQAMAAAGVAAIIEPAFWLGQPRTNPGSFQDYFASLVGWERFRASQFGIRHYCAVGLNSKEANREDLAEAVLDLLPRYAGKEGVVAIGEIGFDEITPLEERYFRIQLDLARGMDLPVMVHTPHRDKRRGTSLSMDICREHGLEPHRVVIDHNNEETVQEVLARGFWAGFTLYPRTKMDAERMVPILRRFGPERIFVNSSADWGISDPLAVPRAASVLLGSGIPAAQVEAVCYRNALKAYGQDDRFAESDWLGLPASDAVDRYEGNSVLRGQQGIAPRKGC